MEIPQQAYSDGSGVHLHWIVQCRPYSVPTSFWVPVSLTWRPRSGESVVWSGSVCHGARLNTDLWWRTDVACLTLYVATWLSTPPQALSSYESVQILVIFTKQSHLCNSRHCEHIFQKLSVPVVFAEVLLRRSLVTVTNNYLLSEQLNQTVVFVTWYSNSWFDSCRKSDRFSGGKDMGHF